MKILIVLLLISTKLYSQVSEAELKANGLVCSLCSRSIEMALKKLDCVEDVNTDLENTTTIIHFKKDVPADLKEVSKAVNKAGFSVGYLLVDLDLSQWEKEGENCFSENGWTLEVVGEKHNLNKQRLKLRVIGSEYMPRSEFKKWSKILPSPCSSGEPFYYVALP